VPAGHGRADDQLRTAVCGTFEAFLTAQTQGLVLLSTSWLGSIHENQIGQQVHAIAAVLVAMTAFETEVIKTIDEQVASCLRQSGQRLTGLAATSDIRWDRVRGEVRMEYPLSDDWLMWELPQYWDNRAFGKPNPHIGLYRSG
jgi:hypothetical protein